MNERPRDRELTDRISELAETLRDVRGELTPQRGRGRPPMRPPTARDVLRFTGEQVVPAAVAMLDANARALEAVGEALREAEERVPAADRTDRRATLERLDAALADLQSAVAGGEPTDPEARRLLADARALRDEVAAHLRERPDRAADRRRRPATRARSEGPVRIAVTDEADDDASSSTSGRSPPGDPAVDVDAELAAIREDVERERRSDAEEGSAADERHAADEGRAGDEGRSDDGSDDDGRDEDESASGR